jgi:hypothetical protein
MLTLKLFITSALVSLMASAGTRFRRGHHD